MATRESDGNAVNDSDDRIESVTTAGVTAAAVAIPPPRRALVTFPAGVTSVSLPCKLDGEDHFIVRVTIGGRGLDFILDTGASGIVIDESVARSLGLPSLLARSNSANAGRYTEHETIVPEMHVGSLSMKDVAVSVIPALTFDNSELAVKSVGLLGFDFIASLALRLDYAHGSVMATDYDAFKPPTGAGIFPIEVRLGEQAPETDVVVDGHVGERFDLDTGGASGVMLTDLFTRRYPGITNGFRPLGENMNLISPGGSYTAKMYRIPHLLFGRVDFTDFPALVIGSDSVYADGDDGIIGPAILSQFIVTTDYADSTIFLQRASH